MRSPTKIALLTLICLGWRPCLGGEGSATGPNGGTNFGDKPVMVRMKGIAKEGQFSEGYLERVSVRHLGGRPFLVGTIYNSGTDGTLNGVTLWLPLSEVAELAEFESRNAVDEVTSALGGTFNPKVARRTPDDEQHVPTVKWNARRFRLPFRVDAAWRGRVERVILFHSRDEGQSWVQSAASTLEESGFVVSLEEDGTYWFAVQSVATDGRRFPALTADFKPQFRVVVESAGAGADQKGDGSALKDLRAPLDLEVKPLGEPDKRSKKGNVEGKNAGSKP